ncbi:MAG: hypothetical protein LBG58_13675 [Planctomycetaceae bacterium]|jgi:type III secretory pathway component EscU|nr:hypothetical protein [Planctomycetaceae bacterium]
MSFVKFAIFIFGAALLLWGCFYTIPDADKGMVFVRCVEAIAGVFNVNIWIILTVIFFMTSVFLFFLLHESQKTIKKTQQKINNENKEE